MKKPIGVGITIATLAMFAFRAIPVVAATSRSVTAGDIDIAANYMSTADAFPATSVLDDFARADGSPGSNWAAIDPLYPVPNIANGQLVATDNASGYWTSMPPSDQEVFLHLTDPPVADDYVLMVRIGGALPTASENGYCAYFNPSLSTVTIKRSDGGDKTVIGGPYNVIPGQWIGFRAAGSTLTAYSSSDGVAWNAIGSATDATYTDGFIGWFVSAFASGSQFAIDDFGGTPGIPPPLNTALPTISGTTRLGDTLTASNGSWDNSPTSYTYQWKRNGSNIPGATKPTYVIKTTDQGTTLTVTVTATNANGSAAATSARKDISAAAPAYFKTCKAFNKRYPHGVGRLGAHDHTSGRPVTNFKRSNRIYGLVLKYNRGLDSDHDGVACERH